MTIGPRRISALAAIASLIAVPVFADPGFDGILDTGTTRAGEFVRKNPAADGRGVAIAVLDCGIDMGVAGLTVTSAGGPKVVVARDFSREAMVECVRAGRDAGGDVKFDRGQIRGVPEVASGEIFAGFLDESGFRNSDVPDLNANGRTDDRFGVVIFSDAKGNLRALLDLDGDGDMAGAVELGTYEQAFETAPFRSGKSDSSASPLTVAVNIESTGKDRVKVDFHMATGAHGTHVAGIAAGNDIAGQAGYDGIAPGAVVLSLKIGHNSLAGGATVSNSMKDALRYAADWGREHRMPVVVNLSYGIGSEVEGYSDIDAFCDNFAIENPHVVIVTSAGNQGPGMSTVGTPAASGGVISVAALLTPGVADEIAGVRNLAGAKVFSFSSRGGELAKPDVAAPGMAASTVPNWQDTDVMAGTSMASPQVAGAAALLLSAMLRNHPDAKWNSGMVARALKVTAKPVSGFTPLDFGAGLIDVPAAWLALEKVLVGRDAAVIQSMKVEVDVPTLGGKKGGAVYWRAGGWVPSEREPVQIRIRPVFSSSADARARSSWFDRFMVSADAPWVGLSKSSIHIKGDGDVTIDTWIVASKVSSPGVHVATVRGVSASGMSFQFPVTVVTPWPDTTINGVRTIRFRNLDVRRAGVVRIPFVVPPGTGMVGFQVKASSDSQASARVVVYDGGGHAIRPLSGGVDSAEGRSVEGRVSPSDLLAAGTCELVIAGNEARDSRLDIDLRFNMLEVPPITWMRQEAGKAPSSSVEVVNNMGDVFYGEIAGRIEGFETSRQVVLRGDRLEEGFSAGPEFERVEIELEMSPEDYNRFTDVAVSVLDNEGRAVVRSGFSQRQAVVSVPVQAGPRQSDFRLEIRGGLANGSGGEVRVSMKMRYFSREKVQLVGTAGGNRLVRLYPGVRTLVSVEAQSTPLSIPGDAVWFGAVEFTDRRDGLVRGSATVRARPR